MWFVWLLCSWVCFSCGLYSNFSLLLSQAFETVDFLFAHLVPELLIIANESRLFFI